MGGGVLIVFVVLVVGVEVGMVMGLGITISVGVHFIGSSVIVVHICTPLSSRVPSVIVVHFDAEHAGRVGQPRAEVTRGVVGQAGLKPGMVNVVGRMSTVLVQPCGGGVEGPVQEYM